MVMALALGATAVADEYFTGDGTAYTLGRVSAGNCNLLSAMPTASTNYAALNNEQWDSLANCGRCAEVKCVDERCASKNNATEIVQILDRCPECKSGDLDLSPIVFKEITGSDPSRLSIQWKFVDCPNPGTIHVCLKDGSNPYWTAVQPTNYGIGVKSVLINGEPTTMVDSAYYFVASTNVDLGAVSVTITSVAGDTVDATLSLSPGSCSDTKQQFSSGAAVAAESDITLSTTFALSTQAPSPTTAAPVSTTSTPTSTTMSTTSTPNSVTHAPASTTATPNMIVTERTTATDGPVASLTEPTVVTASDLSKCRVRTHK